MLHGAPEIVASILGRKNPCLAVAISVPPQPVTL